MVKWSSLCTAKCHKSSIHLPHIPPSLRGGAPPVSPQRRLQFIRASGLTTSSYFTFWRTCKTEDLGEIIPSHPPEGLHHSHQISSSRPYQPFSDPSPLPSEHPLFPCPTPTTHTPRAASPSTPSPSPSLATAAPPCPHHCTHTRFPSSPVPPPPPP